MGEPRPASHYREVLAQRLDLKRAHLFAFRDRDLFPPRDPDAPLFEGESFAEEEELMNDPAVMNASKNRPIPQKVLLKPRFLSNFSFNTTSANVSSDYLYYHYLQENVEEFRRNVYLGGLEHSLRPVAWRHLLNIFPEGWSYIRRSNETLF